MFQISHLEAVEATALKHCLAVLKTDASRIFWSTTQKNNNDWHCKIVDATQEEIVRLSQFIKEGCRSPYDNEDVRLEAGQFDVA